MKSLLLIEISTRHVASSSNSNYFFILIIAFAKTVFTLQFLSNFILYPKTLERKCAFLSSEVFAFMAAYILHRDINHGRKAWLRMRIFSFLLASSLSIFFSCCFAKSSSYSDLPLEPTVPTRREEGEVN